LNIDVIIEGQPDGVTLGENLTVDNPLPEDFNVSVIDDLIVGESKVIENPLPEDFNIEVISAGKPDGVVVGESNSQLTSEIKFSVSDGITLGESLNRELIIFISISNGITVGESSSITNTTLITSVSDDTVLGEIQVISLVDNISKSDGLTLGETSTITNDDLIAITTNDLIIGEDLEMLLESSFQIYVNITDDLIIGESISGMASSLICTASDNLTLGDSGGIAFVAPDLGIAITPDSVWAVGLRIYT
jgi:hypothetical protein